VNKSKKEKKERENANVIIKIKCNKLNGEERLNHEKPTKTKLKSE
jgi:hypothetical protein